MPIVSNMTGVVSAGKKYLRKKKQAMGAEGPKKSMPVKMSDDVKRRKKKAYDQIAAVEKGVRRGLGMK